MSPEPVRPPRADAPGPGDPARAGAAGRGVLFLLAIAAGATIPVQARLNGGLAERAGVTALTLVGTAGALAAAVLAAGGSRRSGPRPQLSR
ncbi:DMT family transporter [Micrococcus endophyticus]|uniref:DMT family transporter n=1 Tax=Micrococcus endophyticus TaxID=455343 RepID=UPI0035A96459